MKGKSAPTFGPLGPWLVTPDEVPDPQNLAMFLDVNGKRRQTGSTKTMIFGVKHLVAFISKFMVLEPGDVITTGTPPGVGLGMKPQLFLKAGDVDASRHREARRADAAMRRLWQLKARALFVRGRDRSGAFGAERFEPIDQHDLDRVIEAAHLLLLDP